MKGCGLLTPAGDRGQRYEVSCFDENQNKRIVIGWTEDADEASRMGTSAELRPSWKYARVTDRGAAATWPDGVPFLDGQRLYDGTEAEHAEIWWQASGGAYLKWDNGGYTSSTMRYARIVEDMRRVGSTAANARSDAVRTIISNMGYSPRYFNLWWGLEPMWRAAMGEMADELCVRRAHGAGAERG